MYSHSTEDQATSKVVRFALPAGAIIDPLELLQPETVAAQVSDTHEALMNMLTSFPSADNGGVRV